MDYKTDVGVSREMIEQYWAQLAIYASLLRAATGERVSAVALIFCRSGEAVVLHQMLVSPDELNSREGPRRRVLAREAVMQMTDQNHPTR